MTLVRVGRTLGMVALFLVCASCGETFRPVAIPITPTPPNPSFLHYVLSLSSNGVCPPQLGQPCAPGATSRIDVSGDSDVATAQVGLGPVHAALLSGASQVFVANQMEDTVSYYSPSSIGPISTVSLPAGSRPNFVATTESATVYVAIPGAGTAPGTVAAIQASSGVVLNSTPVGVNPLALAETPDGKKVYAANQGSGTVTAINSSDKSVNATIPTGAAPVWLAVRNDSQRVYVLNSGDGTVSAINTASDTTVASASVGAGGNFLVYDKTLNRLYVTNPTASTVTVLNSSTDALTVLRTISFTAGSAACPSGCTPLSIAALPDGSRIYVASATTSATCTDTGDASNATYHLGCISTQVTVIKASDFSITKSIPITLSNNSVTPATTKPDTGIVPMCNNARFRLFAAPASDSTRVYVAYCDAGSTAIVRTTPNTSPGTENSGDYLVGSLNAPVSALSPLVGNSQPPAQNPVFVLAAP
jgi:YVTN family beta-propeller protein